MINRLKQIWSDMRSSLWFVPLVMVAAAIALAVFLVEIDGRINHDWLVAYPRLFGAGADGSRGMLSAIAGSMITVAGLTFSLTVVAMAQASSQYTSRILRNFMRDRSNQFVLGYFVGVFAYCLIVLRAIRSGDDEGRFIPSLAAIFGLGLAICSIGVLIFFIHHIAASIQASVIIKTAADETIAAVRRLFPEELGKEADETEKENLLAKIEDSDWLPVSAPENGYIQNVDAGGLIRFAEEKNCILRMERGIGEFVVEGAPLVSIANVREIDEKTIAELQNLYSIGIHRTIEMDSAFGVRQLVDIALKALSPGINDTTTALICIDYLTAILAELGRRDIESVYRSEGGEARIIARGATYASLVADAYDQIRDAAANNVKVYLRLLDSIGTAARRIDAGHRIETLNKQLELIDREAGRALKSDFNRQEVRKKITETERILKLRGKSL